MSWGSVEAKHQALTDYAYKYERYWRSTNLCAIRIEKNFRWKAWWYTCIQNQTTAN